MMRFISAGPGAADHLAYLPDDQNRRDARGTVKSNFAADGARHQWWHTALAMIGEPKRAHALCGSCCHSPGRPLMTW